MLSREFCEYVANDESRYLRAMKAFFGETILSAESFLHTMCVKFQSGLGGATVHVVVHVVVHLGLEGGGLFVDFQSFITFRLVFL